MIMPEGYYTEEKEIKLTQAEIDLIIEELNRVEHGIFDFFNYQSVIDKIKRDCQKVNSGHSELQGSVNARSSSKDVELLSDSQGKPLKRLKSPDKNPTKEK